MNLDALMDSLLKEISGLIDDRVERAKKEQAKSLLELLAELEQRLAVLEGKQR